ncbi:XPA_C domain-containing protein, partial [Haematococcus lacustris]
MAGWDTSGGFETETHEPGFGRACCEACGSLSFSSEYQQAFGVVVCVHCLRDTHYQLIPKGTAKELFLLSDGDLKRLGCITKANPQHKQWSGMKLYLKLQGRIASRVAKRKAAATAESEEGDDAENPLFGIQDAAAAANPKVAEARQR